MLLTNTANLDTYAVSTPLVAYRASSSTLLPLQRILFALLMLLSPYVMVEAQQGAQSDSVKCQQRKLESQQVSIVFLKLQAERLQATNPGSEELGAAFASLGQIYQLVGDTTEALKNYLQALGIFRALGDRSSVSLLINNIGYAYSSRGEKYKALDFYSQSLKLDRELGDEKHEAKALNNIASIYNSLNDRPTALNYYNLALSIFRRRNDLDGTTLTLFYISRAYLGMSDYVKALESLNQELVLSEKGRLRSAKAEALTGMGYVYDQWGQKKKALDFYDQAIDAARDIGELNIVAGLLTNKGNIFSFLNDRQRAQENYNQAIVIFRANGNCVGEIGTLSNLARLFETYDEKEKALQQFDQALEFWRDLRSPEGEAGASNNIARVYASLGDDERALTNFERALEIWRTIGNRDAEAGAYISAGILYYRLGNREKALQYLYHALQLAQFLGIKEGEAQALANLMSVSRASNPSLAALYGKQAINIYQLIRSNLAGLDEESQKKFLKSREDVYRELADILVSRERLPEAQQVLNLLKDEEYSQYVRGDAKKASSRQASLTPKEAAWEKRYREISDNLAALGKERGELLAKLDREPADEQRLNDLEKDITVANLAFKQFLDQLAKEFTPDNVRPDTTAIKDFKALQSTLRILGPGAVALYTIVLKDKYRILIITPDVAIARQYNIPGIELNRKVLKFREALQDRNSNPKPLAQEMYKIIVGPVANDLKGAGAQTLIWVLDGTLRYLPVAALHDGNKYLVESYRNVVFTPAGRDRIRPDNPGGEPWRAVGFGVSKASPDFPALPAVPEELRGIINDPKDSLSANGVLPGTIKMDDDFTEDTMKSLLRQTANQPKYHVVHIASHFKFEPGNETTSVLLLGKGKTLTLDEIETSMTLEGVELLTLSACDTAVGGNANGKEVEGFAVTAQRIGAKSVLATLWPVADQGASHLMQEFYRAREGNGHVIAKAEALRQTQVARLKGGLFSHPYYWAPFILIGNWK